MVYINEMGHKESEKSTAVDFSLKFYSYIFDFKTFCAKTGLLKNYFKLSSNL